MRPARLALLCCLGIALLPPSALGAERSVQLPLGEGTRATGLVTGPDSALWFVGVRTSADPGDADDVVGRITVDGAVSGFPLPRRANPRGGRIALGVDGHLWFTETATGRIGRLAPDGELTEFELSDPGSAPTAIAPGPGGMWFVQEAADKIGRIDPNGAISEFRLPAGSRPSGIAAGPDGAIWFTEAGRARIGRIGSAGVVSEYPLPDDEGEPYAIVAGPGEHLFFTDLAAPRIGRVSTSGAIEELRVPSDHGTRELTQAGDGSLWFSTGNAIGSIAASGETGEPACVECNLQINALTEGPDGRPWFASGAREAGGGALLPQFLAPGTVGRFLPPPIDVVLGKRASRVDDGLTTVGIACHGGTAGNACRGWLRLTAKLPRARGRGRASVLLDQHRYRLAPATSRRLPLRLGARGQRALKRGKRLRVQIKATLIGGKGATRNFVLQPRRRR